ncbi:ribosome recycling factor [Thelephora terrestris]|uniref:Ribosome recycling factor n=1 Tax=Thelephora terrestris TaxID=56493 RepID=A0A9P6L9Z6_9AGAM|nr:ribosome recycling factor [Thelephora terrestris]
MLAAYTRAGFSLARQGALQISTALKTSTTSVLYTRGYSSKVKKQSSKDQSKAAKAQLKSSKFDGEKHGTVTTNQLLPGSQLRIYESALAEYQKCEEKMMAAVDWYRKEVTKLEARVSGRVTPEILAPVFVKIPGRPKGVKIEEVATVGVKDGSVLIVTVFEDSSLPHVETALYEAKIPGVVPQRVDAHTIRIPIPKPTLETRNSLQTAAQREAENTRVQLRKHHQASVRKGKFEKRSIEMDEFQKLTDKHIAEVDKILATMKKQK